MAEAHAVAVQYVPSTATAGITLPLLWIPVLLPALVTCRGVADPMNESPQWDNEAFHA